MVETLQAVSVVKDATLVRLEDQTGVNRNGERLLHQRGLHLLWAALSDSGVGGDIDGCLAHLVVLAIVVKARLARLVRIDGLKFCHVALVVLEGAHLNATVAPSVTLEPARATHELLLGEGKELASRDVVSALQSTRG